MLPAVTLVAERTRELLGVDTSGGGALSSGQVLDAHLFLQMLFEASLVSEFSVAVGALERSIHSTMSRLDVVVQEPLLRKVFSAVPADKRPFSGVDSVVDVQVGLARVSFRADATDEGFFARVHPYVLLQRVVVIASLLTDGAHEVGLLGVGRHVSPEGRPSPETLSALRAGEIPFPSVDHNMGTQMELVGEDSVAKLARVAGLLVVLVADAGRQRVDGGDVARVLLGVFCSSVGSCSWVEGGPALFSGQRSHHHAVVAGWHQFFLEFLGGNGVQLGEGLDLQSGRSHWLLLFHHFGDGDAGVDLDVVVFVAGGSLAFQADGRRQQKRLFAVVVFVLVSGRKPG